MLFKLRNHGALRHLLMEIEKLRKTGAGTMMDNISSGQQEHIIARQIALEDHNHQLEVQLKRLKSLQKVEKMGFKRNVLFYILIYELLFHDSTFKQHLRLNILQLILNQD